MKREILTTADGSKTIHLPDWNEQYHSKHGALQEALHVFIQQGLSYTLSQKRLKNQPISILEYGLGTGLNALLTAIHDKDQPVLYTGVEAYPISIDEAAAMNYGSLLNEAILYSKIHELSWETPHKIHPQFTLTKTQLEFSKVSYSQCFDVIYFDAFGPRVQPELWTVAIFKKAYDALKKGGVLTTYCAQGQARRNMQEAGFKVERLPGPPGKREMLRAHKD